MSQTRSDAEDLEGPFAHIDPRDADERTAAEEDDELDSDLTSAAPFEEYAGEDEDEGDDEAVADKAVKGKGRGAARADRRRKAGSTGKRPASGGAKPAVRKPAAPRRKRTSPALYYRQIIAEMRKVVWPTRTELMTYTWVVIVFVLCIIGFVALIDLGVERAVQAVFG